MFYLKKNDTRIDFMESDVYTRCPICGKEFAVDDFFELLTDDPDFDIFGTSLYCDKCAEEAADRKCYDKMVNTVVKYADQVSIETLEQVYQLITDEFDAALLHRLETVEKLANALGCGAADIVTKNKNVPAEKQVRIAVLCDGDVVQEVKQRCPSIE